jgi:hypothetical protein
MYISLTIFLFRSGIAFYFHLFSTVHVTVRPTTKNVFTDTCQKNLGSVGFIFLIFFLLSAKLEIVVPGSGISFSKFPVSRHLLKLSYDELHSFSTFFALNFDKKLAVE